MNCSKNIINPENSDLISYMTPLKKEETISALNNLIETQNLSEIKTGVCVSCLYEYLNSIKDKLNEEEQKHEDCIKALKDLLLDLSHRKDINKIIDSRSNGDEITEMKNKYISLKNKRKDWEKKLKEKKEEYNKLKEKESEILIKLNENERINEEKRKYKEKLILKKQYLKKMSEEEIQFMDFS